jgi:anti-sigma-K factor RskA
MNDDGTPLEEAFNGDPLDAIAGEYVLGTLDYGERVAVDQRRRVDPALDAAIDAWEARFAPLGELGREIAPPAELFAAITERLNGSAAPIVAALDTSVRPSAEIITLKARVRRWQIGTVVTGLIAASLAAVIVLKPQMLLPFAKPDQTQYVAVLQKDAVSPAFVVSVDLTTKQLTVREVSADKLAGKSYELWLVNANLAQPKSLGVVHDTGFTRGVTLAAYSPETVESSTLAVSLEPEGGSPTGLPTGPVVFAGKLVQATP